VPDTVTLPDPRPSAWARTAARFGLIAWVVVAVVWAPGWMETRSDGGHTQCVALYPIALQLVLAVVGSALLFRLTTAGGRRLPYVIAAVAVAWVLCLALGWQLQPDHGLCTG
jgi:hypothetical protein